MEPSDRNYLLRGDIASIANPKILSGPVNEDCVVQTEEDSIDHNPEAMNSPLGPIERPKAGESAKSAYIKCLNWAKVSALKNPAIKKLTVSFEGLASYSSIYAKRMYKYYDDLSDGKNAIEPGKAMMSFVASNIIRPNLRGSVKKSDFLLLPHTDTTLKPYVSETCIKAWREVHGSEFKLNIIGHSFGGNSSRKLMQSLKKNHPGLNNIQMLLVDARSSNPLNYVTNFKTESNVSRNSVFYQKGLVMPGYAFDGPNTSNTRLGILNLPFINSRCGGLNAHARTTCAPQVQKTFRYMMNR